jgi:hypothetical protein
MIASSGWEGRSAGIDYPAPQDTFYTEASGDRMELNRGYVQIMRGDERSNDWRVLQM